MWLWPGEGAFGWLPRRRPKMRRVPPPIAFHFSQESLGQEEMPSASAAAARAEAWAERIVGEGAAAALHGGSRFGGLVVMHGVAHASLLRQMRREAKAWQAEGRLLLATSPPGRVDSTYCVDPLEGFEDAPGLTCGVALLRGVCAELSRRRPAGLPALEPEVVQLACFPGGRPEDHARWVHKDSYAVGSARMRRLSPARQRRLAARSVTAILYLQREGWRPEWGGALRAHASAVDEGLPPQEYVDVPPLGGTLVLFRSRDLAHEVLPTARRRLALTLWCGDAPAE